jgi:hypothetical protein
VLDGAKCFERRSYLGWSMVTPINGMQLTKPGSPGCRVKLFYSH